MSNEYYTYSKLIEFGLSKKLILQKFPDPILKQNPIYKNAAPMKLYKKDDVDEYMLITNLFKDKIYNLFKSYIANKKVLNQIICVD